MTLHVVSVVDTVTLNTGVSPRTSGFACYHFTNTKSKGVP